MNWRNYIRNRASMRLYRDVVIAWANYYEYYGGRVVHEFKCFRYTKFLYKEWNLKYEYIFLFFTSNSFLDQKEF